MKKIYVWDPFIRIFHWSVVLIVILNMTIFEEGSVHNNLGYALAVLLALRLLWGLFGPNYARLSSLIPKTKNIAEHLKGLSDKSTFSIGHNPLGALMICNLLVTLVAIVLTGHLMTTLTFFGSEFLEEFHEALAIWLMISVLLHVSGVLFESFRTNVNLISAMFTGIKTFYSDEQD
ncbi:MAG: cytochrome b561 [Rhodomicrobium sp.]|nr:MAG: cytochrome b561 [Rhodomicrobium sp.]